MAQDVFPCRQNQNNKTREHSTDEILGSLSLRRKNGDERERSESESALHNP